jgi:hypothetical protein
MASATLAILQDLNPAPELSRRIQIDASMTNTQTFVRMLEMTAILKRCADELDQTSAEVASSDTSKRQRKEVANHHKVLAKTLRAVVNL